MPPALCFSPFAIRMDARAQRERLRVFRGKSVALCTGFAVQYGCMTIHEETIRFFEELPVRDPHQMSALALAYIGDTEYDLYARTFVVHTCGGGAHALHLAAARHVCAAAQAAAYRRMESVLTEEEKAVFRRGRNAHSGTMPKNATVADYRTATGLETLIGFLYMSGNDARIGTLMRIAIEGEKE